MKKYLLKFLSLFAALILMIISVVCVSCGPNDIIEGEEFNYDGNYVPITSEQLVEIKQKLEKESQDYSQKNYWIKFVCKDGDAILSGKMLINNCNEDFLGGCGKIYADLEYSYVESSVRQSDIAKIKAYNLDSDGSDFKFHYIYDIQIGNENYNGNCDSYSQDEMLEYCERALMTAMEAPLFIYPTTFLTLIEHSISSICIDGNKIKFDGGDIGVQYVVFDDDGMYRSRIEYFDNSGEVYQYMEMWSSDDVVPLL